MDCVCVGNRLARLDWVWRIYASRSCGKTRITSRIAATIDALPFSAWPKSALKWWTRRSSRPSTALQLTSPFQTPSSCEFLMKFPYFLNLFLPVRSWFEYFVNCWCWFKQHVCPAGLQNEVGSVFVHAAGWFVYCVNTPQAAKVAALVHFPDARPQIICHAERSSRAQKRRHVNIWLSINVVFLFVHFLPLLLILFSSRLDSLRSLWRWLRLTLSHFFRNL